MTTADAYSWLENATDPATVRWEADQRRLVAAATRGWTTREHFRVAVGAGYSHFGGSSLPREAGGRLFLTRLVPGADQPVLVVLDEPDAAERVLVDPSRMPAPGAHTLEAWEPSWDGRLLAYQVNRAGDPDSQLWVLDVESRTVIDGPIDRVRRSTVAWLADGAGFYYVRRLPPSALAETHHRRRVHLHLLGTPASEDVPVFGADRDGTSQYTVAISADGRWLNVGAAALTAPQRDVWIADLAETSPARPNLVAVHEGVHARSFPYVPPGTPGDGTCFILTDLGAGRGRLVRTTPADPRPSTWRDVIAEDPEAVLRDFVVLDSTVDGAVGGAVGGPVIVAAWARHAVSELTVHDATDGRRLSRVRLPGIGAVSGLTAAGSGARRAWFTFTRFTRPPTTYRLDAPYATAVPWRAPGQPARSAPPARITVRQVTYPSRDGTEVRMFIVSPGGPSRPRPTILTGFGGFGRSMVPEYSPDILAWVAAGGVYAVAGLRGGGEQGADWHRAGKRANKQNTIDDFHAAADHLVVHGWTQTTQLGIRGASHGGLLVAAAMTQRPERYAAVACVAPLLDMARYEHNGVGSDWIEEYGSATDAREARWLMSYSPYHRVRGARRYPAVLLVAFDGGSRVEPWHARKMCAALQAATISGKPVWYRLEHGVDRGPRPVSRLIGLITDELAFFADQLGVADLQPAASMVRTGPHSPYRTARVG